MRALARWGIAPFLAAPLGAWAFGLGDIELQSSLNQPFQARITLVSATPEELQGLRIALAAQETFDRYGLDRPDYLLLAAGAALASIVLVTRPWPGQRWLLPVADAVGLGAFAVAGALAAIRADLALPPVIVLAILTASGGGVLRDLMAARVPLLLRAEVNACRHCRPGAGRRARRTVAPVPRRGPRIAWLNRRP